MPVLSLPSFAKGEIGPSLYGRVDTNMYKVALRTARNAIIHSYGGVSNRPGTLCVSPFKFHTEALFPRIFRFHLGTSDQYVLEFGNLYMRVVRNDEQVLNTAVTITGATTANPVVVTAGSHGRSNGDDVFINMTAGMVQLNKRRFIVRASTTNTFELEDQITGVAVDGTSYDAYTTGGDVAEVFELTTPYVQADLPTLKMVQSGNTLTITQLNYAPRDLTRTDHNVWTLSTPSYAPTIAAPTNGTITSTFDKNFQIFTKGGITVNYQITAISDTDGSFEESLPLTITGTDGSDPPLNTLTWDIVAAATRYAVYRRDNGLYGLLGETELLSFEDKNLATDLTISPPASRNPFSTDFPMASGYYQQRQVYGGTVLFPDKSFYSQTGLRLNMSVSTPLQPADAITASLSSQDVQEIRHYVPVGNDLLVMTNAGEWRVNSGPDSNFSQDTIKQQPETNWGSSHDVPIVVGKTILFVEDGSARVRSLGFSLEIDGFDTNDLTVLANHLLAEKSADEFIISDWTYGQFPEPRVYMVRSDGKVLTMTFDTEQKVIAWTTWDTRGQFKTTTSLRRSVEGVEDGIYFGVRRKTALGGDANFLERLHTRKFADIRNGFFVDLGFKLDNKFKITNITNANPAVFTTEINHDFSDGDEIEVVEIEWFKDIADECSDDTPNLFNDLRFTVANKTADTFELLDFTTLGSQAGFDLQQGCTFEAVLDVSPASAFSEGVTFNSTGLKMYVAELQLIRQYSLGEAYDTLTATDDNITLDTSSESTRAAGSIQLTNSGTRLYVYKTSSGKLFQYNLSVADDLNTAGYSGKSKDMPHLAGGFVFNDVGTKIFFVRNPSTDTIFEMHLTDPSSGAAAAWELDNTLTTIATLDISGEVSNSEGISFNSDGLIMHVSGRVLDTGFEGVHQWALPTAYTLAGAVYTTVCVIGPSFGFKAADLAWNSDGSRFYIPGSTRARIEQFAVPLSGSSSVDVGLSGTAETYKRGGEVRKTVTVIRDLGCLEGLEAVLFFDGSQEPNQTVVDAAITVADGRSIARAAIGLPYTCDIELLDIEVGSGTASTPATLQGKLKKVNSVMVRFHKSRMPQVGPRSDYLTQMRPRQFEKFDQASQLISGDVSVAIKPSWNSNGRIFFRQCDPVPLTILAVFPDISIEDSFE